MFKVLITQGLRTIAEQDALYAQSREVVKEAKALGFEWGGDWTSFKDSLILNGEKGITYVPVRIIAEALGAQVGYNSTSRTVDIITKNTT